MASKDNNAETIERLLALVQSDPESAQRFIAGITAKMLVPHSDGQQEVIEATERYLVLCAGRRYGKVVRRGTPVLTPTGWIDHSALQPGDEVIDAEGNPTKVLEVFPHESWQFY